DDAGAAIRIAARTHRQGPRPSMIHRLSFVVSIVVTVTAAADEPRLVAGQRLEGSFVQERHLQGFKAPLRSVGHFTLVPGKGMLWRGEAPFRTVAVITEDGI